MKILLFVTFLFLSFALFFYILNDFRPHKASDMDKMLYDYYFGNAQLSHKDPSIACANFKNKEITGCFKLLIKKDGDIVKLVYQDSSDRKQETIETFDGIGSLTYIETIYEKELKTPGGIAGDEKVFLNNNQPSLRLVVFGKYVIVFFWKSGKFHKIWTSD